MNVQFLQLVLDFVRLQVLERLDLRAEVHGVWLACALRSSRGLLL